VAFAEPKLQRVFNCNRTHKLLNHTAHNRTSPKPDTSNNNNVLSIAVRFNPQSHSIRDKNPHTFTSTQWCVHSYPPFPVS
jgi:hypothetical protein